MNIKLGKSYSEPKPMLAISDDPHFPSLYLEWSEDYKLPESGVLEVRFKKRSETETTRDGKTEYRVELDITEIVDAKEDKSDKKKDDDRGADLDKYKKEVVEEDED